MKIASRLSQRETSRHCSNKNRLFAMKTDPDDAVSIGSKHPVNHKAPFSFSSLTSLRLQSDVVTDEEGGLSVWLAMAERGATDQERGRGPGAVGGERDRFCPEPNVHNTCMKR